MMNSHEQARMLISDARSVLTGLLESHDVQAIELAKKLVSAVLNALDTELRLEERIAAIIEKVIGDRHTTVTPELDANIVERCVALLRGDGTPDDQRALQ